MEITNIIWAFVWFAVIGGALGLMLAVASKLFAVKTDERITAIEAELPGANCGGCGYAGCSALAEAIVKGEAKTNSCSAGGDAVAAKLASIMGVEAGKAVRMRAQVMCSGTSEYAKKKYAYEGAHSCVSAVKLGGGEKALPQRCTGLGTSSKRANSRYLVKNGVAASITISTAGPRRPARSA